MVRSARAVGLVLVLGATLTPIRVAGQSGSPASITVLV